MLRASVRPSSKLLCHHSRWAEIARFQWQTTPNGSMGMRNTRSFSDQLEPNLKKSIRIVPPGSINSSTSQLPPPAQDTKKVAPNLATNPSPTSPNQTSVPEPPSSSQPDSAKSLPASPPAPKPRRLVTKFLTSLIVLGVLGYRGGIYYSTVNDNFHDFFTEYVPFGEEAVLYLEEREFRKRFPDLPGEMTRIKGNIKTIPSQSGMSWRVAGEQNKGSTGRHTDATQSDAKPSASIDPENTKVVENIKKDTATHSPPIAEVPAVQPSLANPECAAVSDSVLISKPVEPVLFIAPEVDQPSKFPPEVKKIELINLCDIDEPLVRDLVKVINNVIVVVNADNSNRKLLGTMESAKNELSKFGDKIAALKEQASKDAQAKIQAEKEDFDRAAKELIRRVEVEMQLQQSNWQEEYQTERQKIQEAYDKKLNAEIQRSNEINEKRLRNALLEQALEMKKKFTQEIKDRVEEERNSRLGKLSDLSNSVNELEKLATGWTSVVDFNLKTQHLHVAVEAVRASLEKSEGPRPFVRELVALREIASDDPVVNAAIASINPISYQRGIPSSAQLIDRFRRVATEVRKTALLPEDAGIASHASSYILSKLLFKKKGAVSGDDVESVLTRAETFLEEGHLDAAAREVNGLKGWAKTLSRDWLDEVRRVLEVRQALDIIATEARLKSLIVD